VPLGSASPRNTFAIGPAGLTTQLDSADGFGIGPPLAATTAQNSYPEQPQFLDGVGKVNPYFAQAFPQTQPVYGGPPAYPLPQTLPSANNMFISVPSGWSEGFYLLALLSPPPSGTYTLHVAYSQNGRGGSATATAALNGAMMLPPIPPPNITAVGTGASVMVILTPGVVTAVANVLDVNALFPPTPSQQCFAGVAYATVRVPSSGTYAIPGNLGANGTPTFAPAINSSRRSTVSTTTTRRSGRRRTPHKSRRCQNRPTWRSPPRACFRHHRPRPGHAAAALCCRCACPITDRTLDMG
jgi:hypothetical protein